MPSGVAPEASSHQSHSVLQAKTCALWDRDSPLFWGIVVAASRLKDFSVSRNKLVHLPWIRQDKGMQAMPKLSFGAVRKLSL